jgi:hypothetical protein
MKEEKREWKLTEGKAGENTETVLGIPSSFKVEGGRAFDEYKSQDVFIEPHRVSHRLADK